MIYHVTFQNMPGTVNIAGLGKTPEYVSPWLVLRDLLETTGDTVIFVLARFQLDDFMRTIRARGLEKFCVVKMDTEYGLGVTNRNYSDDPAKLKVFVMKGAKSNEQVHAGV
jgi:hypothetical protein